MFWKLQLGNSVFRIVLFCETPYLDQHILMESFPMGYPWAGLPQPPRYPQPCPSILKAISRFCPSASASSASASASYYYLLLERGSARLGRVKNEVVEKNSVALGET